MNLLSWPHMCPVSSYAMLCDHSGPIRAMRYIPEPMTHIHNAGNMDRVFWASTSMVQKQEPKGRLARPEGEPGPCLKFRPGGPLARHARPMKLILFNFFNLVRYRFNVVVIFELYVVKCYSHCLISFISKLWTLCGCNI
jgi:hypothetical protein